MNNNTIKDNATILDRVTYSCDVPNPETNKTYTVEARCWHADGIDSAFYLKALICDQIYLKEYAEDALGVGMEMNAFVAELDVIKDELFEKLWYNHIVDKLPEMLKRLETSIED